MGVNLPYHIGCFPNGPYSYVDAKEQLGLELSVNHLGDYQALFAGLLNGSAVPLNELK